MTQEHGYVLGVGVTTKPDWTVVCAVSRPGDVNAIDEANARLIAAAPDLLEALKACDEAMSYMSEYDIPITLPDMVKAAIAKAIG